MINVTGTFHLYTKLCFFYPNLSTKFPAQLHHELHVYNYLLHDIADSLTSQNDTVKSKEISGDFCLSNIGGGRNI